MKAIVIAALANANAVLPPMDGDGTETQLVYLVDGVRTGGFTLVGNVPGPAPINTCFVLVHTSEATVDAMVASGDYLFVEYVAEAEPEIAALAKSDETDAILYEALAHWADNQTGWMCQLREHYCNCDSFYNYEDEPEPHEPACAFRDAVDWVEAMFAGSRSEIVALADPKPEPKPKHELPARAAVVQWLRNHGYSPALLNAKIPPGAPAHGVRRGLQDLHEVSEDEYGRAWH